MQQALQRLEFAPADARSPRAGAGRTCDQTLVEFRVFAQYGVDAPAAIENARQDVVQFGVGIRDVDAERLRRAFGSQPFPGPLLARSIALWTEQYRRAGFRPGREHQHTVGLLESREVVEIAVLANGYSVSRLR